MHVVQHVFAIALVAIGVCRAQFAYRLPGADIAPAQLAGHHGHFLRMLHQCVVDRDIGHQGEARAIQFEVALLLALEHLAVFQAMDHCGQYLRRVGLEFAQHAVDAHAEHAAVPQMQAAIEVVLGRPGVRFFNKLRHFKAATAQRRAFLEIAETGFGSGWQNAECYQPAPVSQLPGTVDRLTEGRDVGDQMVGGQHQQLCIATVALRHLQGGGGNRRGSVAAERLKDKIQLDAAGIQWAVIVERAEKDVAIGHSQ